MFFGFEPIFITPAYTFNIYNLLFFAVLGLICALIAILFIKFFYFVQKNVFRKLKIPKIIKPAIGCLIVGFVALILPETLGPGYGLIQNAIDVKIGILFILVLILGKIITTSFTIGSGGSGGVFAPSLVIGSMVGGFFALFIKIIFPTMLIEEGSFVVVGMASFITAVANVPIASIIMVSEMTNAYTLLVQAMLACTISYIFSQKWSIYESQVTNQSYSPVHRGKYIEDILENMKASEIMRTDMLVIGPNQTLNEVNKLIKETGKSGFPVMEDNKLVGIIVYRDLFKVVPKNFNKTYVNDIMSKNVVTVFPDDNVFDVLDKIENYGYGRIPVVEKSDPNKILGIITKRDILSAREKKRIALLNEKRKS